MKEEVERRILSKEDEIKRLNICIDSFKNKLKNLTFNEYEIEDYIICIAEQIKNARTEITRLQYEVYELMQILKSE